MLLKTLQDPNFVFDNRDWFDGYTEVLCQLPKRNSFKKNYKTALQNALNQSVSFKEFTRN